MSYTNAFGISVFFSVLIFIILTGFIIWGFSNFLRFREHRFITALGVSILAADISYGLFLLQAVLGVERTLVINIAVFVVTAIVIMLSIKKFFAVDYRSAILAWALVFVIDSIIRITISFVIVKAAMGITGTI